MAHLGIDPGKNGAWAILDDAGRLVDADHFPLDATGEIDAAALHRRLAGAAVRFALTGTVRVTVEKVGSMGSKKDGRKQGVQGMFNFGRRLGAALAVVDILGLPRDDVRPDVWKAATGVTSAKESSLAAARALWPDAASLLTRVKDEARAEAALIARYGMRVRTAKKVVPDASKPLSLAACASVRTPSAPRVRTSTRRRAA